MPITEGLDLVRAYYADAELVAVLRFIQRVHGNSAAELTRLRRVP